jgi:hypothetical protein
MPTIKTDAQIEIETAAAFYRAIGELANVESRHGDELQREAFKAGAALQRTLDRDIHDWNHEDDPQHPRIVLCVGADSWKPWANREKCDVYTTSPEAICAPCLASKAAFEREEAR